MTLLTSDESLVPVAADSLDRHPAAVYLGRLAPGSRRTMRQALEVIAEIVAPGHNAQTLTWAALRYQHTQAVRSKLAEKYNPASANKMLSALRGVLREAWRLGSISAEDYHRAADIESVRGTTLPRGRSLTTGELAALLMACSKDPSPAGARDAALLGILYAAGLRRSEVVALDLRDYDVEGNAITVRQGKGRKDRQVYAPNGAAHALRDWIATRGLEDGPLFVRINKGGRIQLDGLSAQAVLAVLSKRADQAGLAHVSPHDLRRSMISHLLDAGADISTVQRLAGHSNVQTTARYDRRGEREKRLAAELLHVPYAPRN